MTGCPPGKANIPRFVVRMTLLSAIYILYMQENRPETPVLHAKIITGLNPIFDGSFSGGDQFGYALTAIDLDLDRNGINELVVGAPYDDEKGQNSGKLFVDLR